MPSRIAFLAVSIPLFLAIFSGPVAATQIIRPGETLDAELSRRDEQLDDDCYFDEFVIDAEIGSMLRIIQQSDEIDCYLILLTPDGRQLDNDDFNPGMSTDSRVVVLITEPGDYEIIATSFEASETGDYELIVEEIARPNYYGVFMGIERYGRDWEDAPLCDDDAEELYDAFVDSGLMEPADGIVLTNRDANLEDLEDAFSSLNRAMNSDDVFVFFFSGHGDRFEARGYRDRAELDGLDEAICLRDTELTDDDFADMLDRLNAGLIIVVLDSCNSGGMARDIVNGPGRVCYASSEEDVESDFAPELEAGGYLSVFFREAVLGSADLDGDGVILIGELSRYLLHRYYQEVPDPESAIYGFQELVHERGLVSQDTIFCWFPPEERPRRDRRERPN